jgi:hypothetical protein
MCPFSFVFIPPLDLSTLSLLMPCVLVMAVMLRQKSLKGLWTSSASQQQISDCYQAPDNGSKGNALVKNWVSCLCALVKKGVSWIYPMITITILFHTSFRISTEHM